MAKAKTLAKANGKAAIGKRKVPDATAYVEPSQRTSVVWTPALIRAAESSADTGNLRLAAQLCDAILTDDRAAPVLRTRVRSLFGCDLAFEGSNLRKRRVQSKFAEQAEEDFFSAYPEDELGQVLIWGHLMGIGPAKQNWVPRAPSIPRIIPKIAFWHPGNLHFDWTARKWFTKVEGGDDAEINPGDGTWLLHMPGGSHRPWNNGLWRQMGRWWLLKAFAMQDFGRHSEVHGNPIVAATPVKEMAVRKEDRRELAEDLARLGRNSSIALPPGFDIKILEATARTWEMFQAQINLANLAIAIAALGQNMTTEPGTNQNGITGAREMRADLLESDGETTQTFLRDQSLVYWAEFNFGNRELAPWPVWDTAPPEDQVAKANAVKTFAESLTAIREAGYEIENADELASGLGLKLKRLGADGDGKEGGDGKAAAMSAEEMRARAEALSTATTALDRMLQNGVPVDFEEFAKTFGIAVKQKDKSAPGASLFQYHLDYGVLTINEARKRLGLPPIAGGDARPMPSGAMQPPGSNGPARPANDDEDDEDDDDDDDDDDEDDEETDARKAAVRIEAPSVTVSGDAAAVDVANAMTTLIEAAAASASKAPDDGQSYVDKLAEAARDLAGEELSPALEAVLAIVQGAESFEDMRDKLIKAYKDTDPSGLEKVTENALILAELAGRHAILREL